MTKKKRGKKNLTDIFQPSLFPSEDRNSSIEETISSIKLRESQNRSDAEINSESLILPKFPSLILPLRWEALKEEADKKKIPLKPLIKPVHKAILEVEREIRQIKETGLGRLLVISGVTGSGKTRFLNSLNFFVDGVVIHSIREVSLDRRESVERALAIGSVEAEKISIIVLEGREAPGSLTSGEIDILLTTLNTHFRRGNGRKNLFVIPTTSPRVAQLISEQAESIGGMTSRVRPFYVFDGPSKSEFISITNDTLRAFNESRSLAEYGVSEQVARGIAENSESIGKFMSACHEEINEWRSSAEDQAAAIKRKRIHLWMCFCSFEEDLRRNNDIIRALTFGDFQHVQVKRLLIGDSKEAKFWEDKQASFGRAADYLDLRITYLPVRTAVAVITAYGYKEFIDTLKKDGLIERETTRSTAQNSLLNNTAVGAFLQGKGFVDLDISKRGKLAEDQKQIFKEVVKIAGKDDQAINVAIKDALTDWNKDPAVKIYTELSINNNLVCDISIVTPTDIYCLEMKWRSALLQESEVKSETANRVREFTENLPELKNLLSSLGKSYAFQNQSTHSNYLVGN